MPSDKLIHVLIDLRDVLGEAVPGETITFETVKPRESVTGGVVRPRQRLIELDENGCGAVDLEPGPIRVIFHDVRGREVVLNSTVPAEHDIITLRELILLDVGTVDSVPGLRDALAGKADEDHFHHVDDIVGIRELAAALAPAEHQHIIAEVLGLTEALDQRSRVEHVHSLPDIPGLADILDAKLDIDALEDSVFDFAAQKLAEIVDGAPESLDTLREVADALANQDDSIQAIFAALGERAMKSHKHQIGDVADLQKALDGKATTQALTSGLAGKADKSHKHQIGDVADLQKALDGKATTQALTSGLAGKADKSHKHQIGDVTNLKTELDKKADAAPTQASGKGWTAYKRAGVVTLQFYRCDSKSTVVIPAGFRPPVRIRIANFQTTDRDPAVNIFPDGSVQFVQPTPWVSAVVTYVTA